MALATTRLNVLAFLLVLLLDQATKLFACRYLNEDVPVVIIPKFFNVTLGFNRGVAFGMFSQLPDYWRWLAQILCILIALFVLFGFAIKRVKSDRIAQAAVSSILAGAVSNNIIDRFRFDAVVDLRAPVEVVHLIRSKLSTDSAVKLSTFSVSPECWTTSRNGGQHPGIPPDGY